MPTLRRLLIVSWIVSCFPASMVAAQTMPRSGSFMFDIDQEVLPGDEAMIREGMRLAEDFAVDALGVDPMLGVIVQVTSGEADQDFVAYAGNNRITIQTGHPIWIETYAPLRRQQNPIHEYFHLVQESLSGEQLSVQNVGPVWMIEGSAEYLGWQALIESGVVNAEDIRAFHMSSVTYDQQIGPLANYETGTDLYAFGSSYSLSALAIEMLVESSDITSIADFYIRMREAPPWQEAFTQSFGQSPEAFYAEFEESRFSFGDFDPADPFLGSLQLPAAPVDGTFEVSVILQDAIVRRGDQSVLITATVPGAGCNLEFFSIDGDPLLSYPARADTRGIVFWLWTIEEDNAPGTATVDVACGGTPIVTTIQVL